MAETSLPKPRSRDEEFLYAVAQKDATLTPKPKTRSETYMQRIAENAGSGGGGTGDYNDLSNKPQINGVELSGDVGLDELGLPVEAISSEELEAMWDND